MTENQIPLDGLAEFDAAPDHPASAPFELPAGKRFTPLDSPEDVEAASLAGEDVVVRQADGRLFLRVRMATRSTVQLGAGPGQTAVAYWALEAFGAHAGILEDDR